MSAINTSSTSSYDDNLSTGHKVVSYAIKLLAWGAALSVAFSCSSVIMGIIMFFVMSFFMALLSIAAQVYLAFKGEAVASIGSVVNNTTARVSSLFTRKASV